MPTIDETSMSVDILYLDVVYSQHSTSTVLQVRIPSLSEFGSNGNQYCTSSKPVECQLSIISLLQSFMSTAIEYRALTAPVVSQ